MSSENKTRNQWSTEELDLLKYYEPKFKSKKWKNIANELRKRGFSHSQTQYPKANKKKWEEEELQHLYQRYEEVGTKWCLIQKQLNRTQNSIKNRFYGTLRNYVRFVLSYFDTGRTCYNTEISKLSPKFLTDLFGSLDEFEFMNGHVRKIIYDMKYIVNKKVLVQEVKKQRKIYQKLNQIILQTFDQQLVERRCTSDDAESSVGRNQSDSENVEDEHEASPIQRVTVVQESWQSSFPPKMMMLPCFPYPQYQEMNHFGWWYTQ